MIRVRFQPQVWINGYAVNVDTDGPDTWEVEDEHAGLQTDSYDSDMLRYHQNAPKWCGEWSGPFYVEMPEPSK